MAKATENSTSQQVLITRRFNAPRQLVFDAWADPEQLSQWFAPRGCTVSFHEFDFREGGEFHSCIRSPGGDCWCKGVYRRIIAPELIEFTMVVSNENKQSVEPIDAGMDPDWPRETVVTVSITEAQGQTQFTLRQTVDEALAKRTGAYPSWLEMLDHLAERLESQQVSR